MPRDRWEELCDSVAADDGFPTRDAGQWTADKLYYWNRYLEITTTAMVGKPFWSAVVYVDLFAGPGVLRLRESGRRIPGSVLLAANTPKQFKSILVCEKNQNVARACQSRLAAAGASDRSRVFVGDCNVEIDELIKDIPSRSLTVAFVDPEGLHVKFETLRKLTDGKRVDLLVLFADKMDAVRNIEYYRDNPGSNLDGFLGERCDWRAAYDALPRHDDMPAVCIMLEGLFREQLRKELGYKVFSGQVMRSSKTSIYRVVYASKHDKGAEFWNKISKIDSQGQKTFEF